MSDHLVRDHGIAKHKIANVNEQPDDLTTTLPAPPSPAPSPPSSSSDEGELPGPSSFVALASHRDQPSDTSMSSPSPIPSGEDGSPTPFSMRPLPPDSPDDQTPPRTALHSENWQGQSGDTSDEVDEIDNLLSPKKKASAHASRNFNHNDGDFDDENGMPESASANFAPGMASPSPPVSPHLRRSHRLSLITGGLSDNAVLHPPAPDEDEDEDGLAISSSDEPGSLVVDPMTRKLADAGLFVVRVDDNTSVLACIDCQYGLRASKALAHVTSKPHKLKISKETRDDIAAWIRDREGGLAGRSQELPEDLPKYEAPIEGLPIINGFACDDCNMYTSSMPLYRRHWNKKHRNKDKGINLETTPLQTHFKKCPKYFPVEPILRNTNPRSLVHQYVKQFSKEVAAGCSSALGAEPISSLEVPPLLQETRWHKHLSSFTCSSRQTKVLRQLVCLPTGRMAEDDPLGDTLQQTIVLYMRSIRKKAHMSPLDVGELLIQCPP